MAATRPTVAYGLIAAIDAVDSDAEMDAGCSNTTRDEVQRTSGFSILVS